MVDPDTSPAPDPGARNLLEDPIDIDAAENGQPGFEMVATDQDAVLADPRAGRRCALHPALAGVWPTAATR